LSLDLYERETSERLSRMDLTTQPEVGAFDGFVRGTGQSAMQTFAKQGRAIGLAAAAPILGVEAFTGGTELSDRFFKQHEEVFQNAVDRWTPRPGEVGVAGQITGQLVATLPMVIASPGAAVGMTGLATAEDLAGKGVDPTKATATGMVQAAGLGLGIWMPVIGQTLAQRVLLGGAGFNVAQGVTTRAASELILEGTPAAEDFKMLDPTALTLDVMLGAAFGGIVHMSPSARAQGAKFWQAMDGWSKNLKPTDVDALLVTRQAQHLNADSLPGKPADDLSLDAHVQRARHAVDQLARDQKVDVSDLPEGKFEVDEARMQEMSARADELVQAAEEVRKAERLPKVPETEAPPARVSAEPPPPRGDGERPGGAEAERPRVHITPNDEDTFVTAKTDAGKVGAKIENGLIKVVIADIPNPANRGRGFGLAMYEELIKYAESRGLRFASDETVETPAVRVYERLEELGYTVKRNPAARELGLDGDDVRGLYAPKNESVFEVSGQRKPTGASPAKPPEAEVDPVVREAQDFIRQRGDMEVTMGRDADGNPVTKKLKSMLGKAMDVEEGERLFQAAAACMLGGA
jgi:hypothetical protein